MSGDDPELEGIKVRADAMRQLGITDPHVVDEEYRKWMAGRLQEAAVMMSRNATNKQKMGPKSLARMATTMSLCAGMMTAMASMLAEHGRQKMEAEREASAAVEKETRAGKAGDDDFEMEGTMEVQSASKAAVLFKRKDGRTCWLPKSQIRGPSLPMLAESYPLTGTIAIPRWLAEKKGLV